MRDSTHVGSPASIAAVGLALACYVVGAERGFMERAEAAARTLTTLRFFWNSPHGKEPDATGYKGFYYHFLDMSSGRRAWNCELSTVDTAYLLAGALAAAAYFAERTRRSARSGTSPTGSTAASNGHGPPTAAARSLTAGGRSAGFFATAGAGTARP